MHTSLARPEMTEMPTAITPALWRNALSQFASGVTVITTYDENSRATGTTVSAFSSLSLDPMLLIICLDKKSQTLASLLAHQHFAVNILAEPQQHVAFQCGSRNDDKFAKISHSQGPHGLPLINGCCAHIECALYQNVEGGDHAIIIGKPLSMATYPEIVPMIYHQGKFLQF